MTASPTGASTPEISSARKLSTELAGRLVIRSTLAIWAQTAAIAAALRLAASAVTVASTQVRDSSAEMRPASTVDEEPDARPGVMK